MNYRILNVLLLFHIAVATAFGRNAQIFDPDEPQKNLSGEKLIKSDYWSATDGLGRVLPGAESSGSKRNGKKVAMFYWTWHSGPMVEYGSVGNVSEILKRFPEALADTKHPAWDRGKGNTHFWEQPLFGYYRTTDPWVLRKHAEMLADAGVDAIFMDCTNYPFTWKSSYDELLRVWNQARLDGVNVPKIAFMLPFGPGKNSYEMLKDLYSDIYLPRRYPDMWFLWDGKPIIMAYPQSIPNDSDQVNQAMLSFFTFRPGQPDYVNGPDKKFSQWGWLENYPQHKYMERADGSCEEVTVGVAQNAGPLTNGHCSAFNLPGTYGRSYTFKNGQDMLPGAFLQGHNFQEQWDRAIALDPDLVFVTGWNEYVAGKWEKGSTWTGEPFSFVDEFDSERSRDIEPNKGWGELGDLYYYQLIQNVRKFKGMDRQGPVSGPKTIIRVNPEEWKEVLPVYRHYKGNTMYRDHPGHADASYRNTSGRNDIVEAKVARDKDWIYFYVQTDQIITKPTNQDHWMWLFIDIDRSRLTGWEGYDYLVNLNPPLKGTSSLAKCVSNGWEWNLTDSYSVTVKDNTMTVKIKKSSLGIIGDAINFEFKWSDNMQQAGNIMDFYVNGDAAPGGRFNFVYSTKKNE
jgi:hypothetical protein